MDLVIRIFKGILKSTGFIQVMFCIVTDCVVLRENSTLILSFLTAVHGSSKTKLMLGNEREEIYIVTPQIQWCSVNFLPQGNDGLIKNILYGKFLLRLEYYSLFYSQHLT